MLTGRLISTVFKSVQVNNYLKSAIILPNVKHLYSKTTLGIDNFVEQCQRTQTQMASVGDKFKEKMLEFSQDNNSHVVFTEDLKNMIHLSQNDKDIELIIFMIKKFNKQNKELRFGSFVFGPVVMRMFYHFDKSDLALECFKSEELTGFFDQIITYQILLDLLYENQQYQEVLNCVDLIRQRQVEGMKYPRNVVVLAMAACYKLNSKESLEYALRLWQELKNTGHFPLRRATTFCSALAYNQGNPEIALEMLTSAKNQNYTTVRNLKVACLAAVGRVENVIPILKNILMDDQPSGQTHTFNNDVIEKIKTAVSDLDNPEIALEFTRIEQLLRKQGHIVNSSIDEQLCREIQTPSIITDQRQNRMQPRFRRPENAQRTYSKKKYYTYQQRPGLEELV